MIIVQEQEDLIRLVWQVWNNCKLDSGVAMERDAAGLNKCWDNANKNEIPRKPGGSKQEAERGTN